MRSLSLIHTRITTAATRAGRDPHDVKLLVAGKYADTDQLLQLIKAGQKLIGENRAQDLTRKYTVIGNQAEWHFIGHLQRNKIRDVVPLISLLHSLDSLRLAEALEKELTKIDKILPVLVEVNTSFEAALQLIKDCQSLPHLNLTGLMTMGAFVTDPEKNRSHFRSLRQLAQTVNLPELSMGTSQDFEVAIEEGATIIRLGRIVFG